MKKLRKTASRNWHYIQEYVQTFLVCHFVKAKLFLSSDCFHTSDS